ncbi:MAG: 23S rRNA (uracil(1939)-C(5))-methyltransferase RlmD [Faecalibacterium sp.]|nr:23S rRNA (uracil(1939)-C(5))-methyltransferase RlmD [Ruminococcus flavefaciens]MCM1392039.1 23S rRNA (uracil(1939)-C(5))-methyltransferase RlmD [Ruminococcus sp.]MCM1484846.1 23S rRNA (uracil(1939)-C(5))-methyltransferase RlmD [Faecalibacterium sp.]
MSKNGILKKNDEITLDITALSSQGSGIGHYEGMAIFVEGAAVGDKLLIHIIKVKSSYAVGIIKKIIKPSKARIESDCFVSEKCGGCSYRHIRYTQELAVKKQCIQDALERIGGLDVKVDEILCCDESNHYRNKAQYPVGMDSEGHMLIGFYAKRSHRIIDCRNCRLQPKEFEAILKIIERWSALAGISCYNEETGRGVLRHIYLRKAQTTGQTMVCLVINADDIAKKDALIQMLTSADETICSIVLNINKSRTNVILGEKCITLWGTDYIEDILCGLCFRISPLSFYQVNAKGAEILYTRAREYAALKENETLLDLYCGAGTIGMTMAKDAKQVIGVEIIEQAIENAKENARLNGIDNMRFICSDAGGAAQTLLEEGLKPDVVVLDPPRKGCSRQTIDAVVGMRPSRVVYVSCDPATLARDCKIFEDLGYKTEKATAVDMFPRTVHVETVVQLVRKTPDTYVDFEVNLDELDLTVAESKATYQEIKDYVLDKCGLSVTNLNIAQIKRKLGIIERENYNFPKSDKSRQPKCTPEKERAIKAALKHFRMIK